VANSELLTSFKISKNSEPIYLALKKQNKTNKMKKTGIILIVIGLLFTVITGVRYFTKEKVVDIGSLKISASVPHRVNWSPLLGVGIMIVGGGMLVLGKKN
jgi:multisubunit Na+/H+ antiporter MnhB subunit